MHPLLLLCIAPARWFGNTNVSTLAANAFAWHSSFLQEGTLNVGLSPYQSIWCNTMLILCNGFASLQKTLRLVHLDGETC
jgi:hypothetical protein